jgi:hypothetical protein
LSWLIAFIYILYRESNSFSAWAKNKMYAHCGRQPALSLCLYYRLAVLCEKNQLLVLSLIAPGVCLTRLMR